jgi:hypothetical protein
MLITGGMLDWHGGLEAVESVRKDKLVIMGGRDEPSDVGCDVIPLTNGFCNGISRNGIKQSIFGKKCNDLIGWISF